jgi:hypothetical protein
VRLYLFWAWPSAKSWRACQPRLAAGLVLLSLTLLGRSRVICSAGTAANMHALSSIFKGLTHLYNGFCGSHLSQKDPAKAEYGKQWYSNKLIKTLAMCDTSMGEKDATTIKEIVLDLKIQYTPEQR